jgi:transposase
MHYIEPEDRTQCSLFTSFDDMITADNAVRFLDLIVNSIVENNRDQFTTKGQESVGRKAYNPATLLKLYIYGYFNGIRSSRKLEAETHRNIEVMWLLGNLRPDHKTIADFRKDCSDQIKFTTRRFREFLRDEGLIVGKRVGIDGTRIKANAQRSVLTLKNIERRLAAADSDLDRYLQQLADADLRDDLLEEYGESDDVDGINKHLIDKIAGMQEEIERLHREKEALEEKGIKQMSATDPDARVMRTMDRKVPSYNVQLIVDEKHKLIADSEVVTAPIDQELLEPMLASLKEEIGIVPEEAILDKGYFNPVQIQNVEKNQATKCYIPVPESSRSREKIKFTYDSQNDEYRCSEGKRLVLWQRRKKKRNRMTSAYKGIECDGCLIRSQCTQAKTGRFYHRYHDEDWNEAYCRRMKGILARKAIALRKPLVEHPFGTIRLLMGKIPLLLRGITGVQTEINLHTTVYNIKRLLNIEEFTFLQDRIQKYDWRMA